MDTVSSENLKNYFQTIDLKDFIRLQKLEGDYYFERVSSADKGIDSSQWPAKNISLRKNWFKDFFLPESQRLYQLFEEEFIIFNRNGLSGKWRLRGWEFLLAVDEFIKKYPDIVALNCVDNLVCSSYLVLIPRISEQGFFGTTVIYIPQNGEPCEFFLDPDDLNNVVKRIQTIQSLFIYEA